MRHTPSRIPHVLSLSFLIVASVWLLSPSAALAADAKAKVVNVDYVIALMDAGIDQKEIIHRIEARNLSFRLEPGDVDRLREAGAGKSLIQVVVGEGAAPEAEPPQGGSESSQWGRPNRMGAQDPEGAQGNGDDTYAPPATGDQNDNGDEGIEETPYSGGYGGYGSYGAYPDYDYYWPGYYGFVYTYGYPYYYYPSYYPYYYPYRSYYYGAHYYPRHFYRTAPRGGGWSSGAPRGGSAPRSGGGFHSSPRGGGGGHSSPRGSHH